LAGLTRTCRNDNGKVLAYTWWSKAFELEGIVLRSDWIIGGDIYKLPISTGIKIRRYVEGQKLKEKEQEKAAKQREREHQKTMKQREKDEAKAAKKSKK
jgi:hypothetical protein